MKLINLKPYFIFSIFFLAFFCYGKTKSKPLSDKILPSHLQKAYTIQRDSIIYTRPNFDSFQITTIPAGTMVTISKKIYRPKHNFGTFYRIYIQNPKRIKAYISEIDVTPRYIKKGSAYQINPSFKKTKKKLHHIKEFSSHYQPDTVSLEDTPISKLRWSGLIIHYLKIYYEDKKTPIPSWFFNMQINGPGLPIPQLSTVTNLGISFTPPVINNKSFQKGYVLMGDFLLQFPIVELPSLLISLNGGLMIKAKGSRSTKNIRLFQIGVGLMSATRLLIRIKNHLSLALEGKYYYDFQEKHFSYGIGGGLLVAF